MAIVFVGIDLAKNVFAVHGVNPAGKPELVRPSVPRTKLHEMIAALPPCTIGMEACSGAHHWARLYQALGHAVKLMARKFVAPYRLSGKVLIHPPCKDEATYAAGTTATAVAQPVGTGRSAAAGTRLGGAVLSIQAMTVPCR